MLSFWQAKYETTQALEFVGVPGAEYAPAPDPFAQQHAPLWAMLLDELHLRTPQSWPEAGLVGLWILSVSWLTWGRGIWPTALSASGVAAGALMLAAVFGSAVQVVYLALLGQFAGFLVLMPLWFLLTSWPTRAPQQATAAGSSRASTTAGAAAEDAQPPRRSKRAPRPATGSPRASYPPAE